jgi:hypothetical protein
MNAAAGPATPAAKPATRVARVICKRVVSHHASGKMITPTPNPVKRPPNAPASSLEVIGTGFSMRES